MEQWYYCDNPPYNPLQHPPNSPPNSSFNSPPNAPEKVQAGYPIICHNTKQATVTPPNGIPLHFTKVYVSEGKCLLEIPKEAMQRLEQGEDIIISASPELSEVNTHELAEIALAIEEEYLSKIEPSKNKTSSGKNSQKRRPKRSKRYYEKGYEIVVSDIAADLDKLSKLKIVEASKTSANAFVVFRSMFQDEYREKVDSSASVQRISTISSDHWGGLTSNTKDIFKTVAMEHRVRRKQMVAENKQIIGNKRKLDHDVASAQVASPQSQASSEDKKKFYKGLPDTPNRETAQKIVERLVGRQPERDTNEAHNVSNINATDAAAVSNTVQNVPFVPGSGAGNMVTPSAARNQGEPSTALSNMYPLQKAVFPAPVDQAQPPQLGISLQALQQPVYNATSIMPTPQSAVQDQLLPLDSFLQVPQWSTYNVANTVSTMPAAQTFQGDVLPGLEQLLMPVNQGNMALENINGLPQENTSTFVWSAISSSAIVNNPATNSMPAITAFTWPDLPENFAELGK